MAKAQTRIDIESLRQAIFTGGRGPMPAPQPGPGPAPQRITLLMELVHDASAPRATLTFNVVPGSVGAMQLRDRLAAAMRQLEQKQSTVSIELGDLLPPGDDESATRA